MNKKATRRVLGKGLSSLIPSAATIDETPVAAAGDAIVNVDYSAIEPNPFQPRREFVAEELQALAESIATQGLLQPILVRQKEGGRFEIISGERRFRALGILGRDKAPCVVKPKVSDREMMELALVENIQREDLNEIEKADAYQKLILEYHYTHEELAKQMGKSRTAVTNSLRLLNLAEEIKAMVRTGALSMGHARALLAIDDERRRLDMAKKIVEEDLSVRDVERLTQAPQRASRERKAGNEGEKPLDPDTAEAVSRLQYRLGTQISLKATTAGRGKIEIEFFSAADLTRLFDLLLSEKQA
jgi:ParB family transcriptional regulator, chromosome partitioning protein